MDQLLFGLLDVGLVVDLAVLCKIDAFFRHHSKGGYIFGLSLVRQFTSIVEMHNVALVVHSSKGLLGRGKCHDGAWHFIQFSYEFSSLVI